MSDQDQVRSLHHSLVRANQRLDILKAELQSMIERAEDPYQTQRVVDGTISMLEEAIRYIRETK